jgi:hypothetical protein
MMADPELTIKEAAHAITRWRQPQKGVGNEK